MAQMDSFTINVNGQDRGLGLLLSNEDAKEFYLKFFVGQALIPINCFTAAFKMQVRSEGYSWSQGLAGFTTKNVDISNDGLVSLDEINAFFEQYWTTEDQKMTTVA